MRVRLDARRRFAQWLPGLPLIVMLTSGPVRVNDRVMFVSHIGGVMLDMVVRGPSDVEMKRCGVGQRPLQGEADDHDHT